MISDRITFLMNPGIGDRSRIFGEKIVFLHYRLMMTAEE